ncbi:MULTISPECIES: Tim44/TimA family putative adaptor protein [unclassified Phyllobacterium]|uniref:Tim44/TimA family putative adaptor protein n=1 Tax=unclassified Phyllobacterium TaxID=2638441 RepID=UPI001AD58DE4|nr:Tim44/TimA family putative adaptor protein [uncultured Phyllobacterium sp.]MBN9138358.1 Tim44 domain-containing protein [Phyllobacterium sp.]MBQ9350291.1 Tim44 domain-containing protein [Phyllobacterium sp.]
MEYLDFGTIFFFVAAVVIFLQLRKVLGRRTGNERPPFNPYASSRTAEVEDKAKPGDNVVSLPRRGEPKENQFEKVDALAKPGTPLNEGLRTIQNADPAFDPAKFLEGSKMAYEMIVMSFADGDRKTLKSLLSREVFDGFVSAIADRESRGEKVQSSFVGINKADITGAEMKGTEAHVTVRVVSELISATLDKDGNVIDGDKEAVAEVKDVWTYARDTRSKDPNWKLVATEAED